MADPFTPWHLEQPGERKRERERACERERRERSRETVIGGCTIGGVT